MSMLKLMDLPYAYDALEPNMSAETLKYHHDLHHKAYIDNANKILENSPNKDLSLEELVVISGNEREKNQALFNNVHQAYSHNIFWMAMKPNGGGEIPTILKEQIEKDFGSVDAFKEQFITKGLAQFGSGWAWLAYCKKEQKLIVVNYPNAETPIYHGLEPILPVDVWEHSYYIDYRNRRAEYLNKFLQNLVNWDYAQELLLKAKA